MCKALQFQYFVSHSLKSAGRAQHWGSSDLSTSLESIDGLPERMLILCLKKNIKFVIL